MWRWLLHVLGCDNPAGPAYLWWSGAGADLSYLAALGIALRRLNCHAHGCWRIGLHRVHVSDGHYTTCSRHRPGHDGRRGLSAAEIHELHAQAKEDQ